VKFGDAKAYSTFSKYMDGDKKDAHKHPKSLHDESYEKRNSHLEKCYYHNILEIMPRRNVLTAERQTQQLEKIARVARAGCKPSYRNKRKALRL